MDSDLKKHLVIPETRIVNVRSLNKLDIVQGTKHDIYVSKIINGKVMCISYIQWKPENCVIGRRP